jgi:CII-binding regulator of phage lambda lysogenization HflD
VNNENFDRIVEERVQAQISELETRMTSQMLRLERRMEERMQDRMDQLESKIDKIGSMLSAILSHQKEI